MSRSLRRGTLAATALVFSLATLSACGAGNNAQTLGVKPDNAATTLDEITLQNITVITQPEADAEGPAVVTGTVFNNDTAPQTLDSVKLPGTNATVKLSPAKGSGPITVPAQGSVQLGGEGNASAVVENGHEAAKNGDAQQVVFSFSKTGEVGLRAFVFPSNNYYKSVGPSSRPSAPASPSAPAAGAPGTSPSDSGSPEAGTAGEGTDAGTDAGTGTPESPASSGSASGEAASH
ncbi:DUF461 domain-containing protein [Streptomyces sp. NPDC093085]|uniref:DUF461 domain-containing protein n=1 Tax=Streptomyces sp. NPDC093085 TaxID=3155068 RepID=UPI00341CFF11